MPDRTVWYVQLDKHWPNTWSLLTAEYASLPYFTLVKCTNFAKQHYIGVMVTNPINGSMAYGLLLNISPLSVGYSNSSHFMNIFVSSLACTIFEGWTLYGTMLDINHLFCRTLRDSCSLMYCFQQDPVAIKRHCLLNPQNQVMIWPRVIKMSLKSYTCFVFGVFLVVA